MALLAAGLSTTVSATIGVITLSLAGFAAWQDYGAIWTTWWLGDAVGALVVAPAVIAWAVNLRVRWTPARAMEALALIAGLTLSGLVAYGGMFSFTIKTHPLQFLTMPFLIWSALRFGQREVAAATVLLSGIAITGTLHGLGPFAIEPPAASLPMLQAFMGVTSLTMLAMAAVVEQRRRAEAQLRQLATSDPLTGLANYRQLVNVMDAEIKRSHRTGRLFTMVLLDVDGLKAINDQYGHVVGSRALCRLAEAMRASSRAVDTPARFGGDEFALILPETDEAAARQVAHRITERLARDEERPAISISAGVSLYPRDGTTVEDLLTVADGFLYDVKARAESAIPQKSPPPPPEVGATVVDPRASK